MQCPFCTSTAIEWDEYEGKLVLLGCQDCGFEYQAGYEFIELENDDSDTVPSYQDFNKPASETPIVANPFWKIVYSNYTMDQILLYQHAWDVLTEELRRLRGRQGLN